MVHPSIAAFTPRPTRCGVRRPTRSMEQCATRSAFRHSSRTDRRVASGRRSSGSAGRCSSSRHRRPWPRTEFEIQSVGKSDMMLAELLMSRSSLRPNVASCPGGAWDQMLDRLDTLAEHSGQATVRPYRARVLRAAGVPLDRQLAPPRNGPVRRHRPARCEQQTRIDRIPRSGSRLARSTNGRSPCRAMTTTDPHRLRR